MGMYFMKRFYNKNQIIKSLQLGKKTDKYVKESLARSGRTLILDENVNNLINRLRDKNYTIYIAYGIDKEILENQVRNGVFITNNEIDFINKDLQELCYYGLILIPNQNEYDLIYMSNAIEKVLMKANFASELLQVWKITADYKFFKVR